MYVYLFGIYIIFCIIAVISYTKFYCTFLYLTTIKTIGRCQDPFGVNKETGTYSVIVFIVNGDYVGCIFYDVMLT
uniref:Uncharacterized protein n=1 Tax=Panstrongylus lignarius TaxID=156445 RepID=A0A224Y3Y6_9HEMI